MNVRDALIGVVVGAVVTVAAYEAGSHFGGGAEDSPAESTAAKEASRPSGTISAPQLVARKVRDDLGRLSSENAGLKVQNNMLKAKVDRNNIATADGDQRWINKGQSSITVEMPEEEWRSKYPQTEVDLKIEGAMRDRLESHLSAIASDSKVECRDGCCRMSMTADDTDRLGEIMNSSVGVGWFPAETKTMTVKENNVIQGLCLGGNQPPDLDAMPDRGIERDALVENALPALSICAKKADAVFDLKMALTIDQDGQISDIDSTEKYAGHAAADCAGAALLTHSAFAPWTQVTTMILEFRLDPDNGASVI